MTLTVLLSVLVATVTVGPDGAVQKAVMYKSIGTPDGDKEALRVANETTDFSLPP